MEPREGEFDAEETPVGEPTSDDAEQDLPVGGTAAFELLLNPVVRQFVKFCIVGGSSTAIDLGLFWYLRFHAPYGPDLLANVLGDSLFRHYPSLFAGFSKTPADATVPVFKIVSATIAIANAFIWNRRWTFRIRGKQHRSVQFQKFFAVAAVGMVLNTCVTTELNNLIGGEPKLSLLIASAVATVIVAVWNFMGQKYWTFKHRH